MKPMKQFSGPILLIGLCAACGNQATSGRDAEAPEAASDWESESAQTTDSSDPTSTARADSSVNSSTSSPETSAAPSPSAGSDTASTEELDSRHSESRPLETMTGKATYYGNGLKGRPTASGEIFDPQAKTAAMVDVPLGSVVRVVRLDKPDQSVTVRVNDRMANMEEKIIDLSVGAAQAINLGPDEGVADVRVEVLEKGEESSGSL